MATKKKLPRGTIVKLGSRGFRAIVMGPAKPAWKGAAPGLAVCHISKYSYSHDPNYGRVKVLDKTAVVSWHDPTDVAVVGKAKRIPVACVEAYAVDGGGGYYSTDEARWENGKLVKHRTPTVIAGARKRRAKKRRA